ncbi:alpha/beta fold hydrolase [Rhodobacteraceae bacterium CCMM004]|nr:alpha/beta fold hydrolase [Rhodobacteraceae bacterium CCMM004]
MNEALHLRGFETRSCQWGKGARSLMCLHPLGQNADFHARLASHLGPGWSVHAFDQRGHGAASQTAADDLQQLVDDAEAFLDRVGPPAHLAGFSMGGAVAALLAARRISGIETLTLVATPDRGLPVFAERACALAAGSVAAVTEPTIARWFGRTEGDSAIAVAREALSKLRPEGFDAAWRALASFQGYARIAHALPPTLCIAFADDLSTPPDVADRIADLIRAAGGDVRRIDIADAGHMGLLQKPAEVAAAIADFVEMRG